MPIDAHRPRLRPDPPSTCAASSLAGLLLVALSALGLLLAGCGADRSPDPATAPAAESSVEVDPTDFELAEVEISELQRRMEAGETTSREIVSLYLDRIETLDRKGPELRAVIEVSPDALEQAEALDAEREEKGARGPLHGIPILLKDNIATLDGTETTAGSLALVGAKPSADSFVAERLRAAGMVILGKANLSEWANIRSNRSTSGWSARGGQTRNPYVLDRNPCGSSSGSGSAVAASLAAAAIGTETNGSIVCPSSANGIVGIKPTVGLVSRSRIIPISHSQDTAGPMTRTVRDGALVLGALTGVDPQDEATLESEGRAHDDYSQFLDENGLEGARIGVSRQHFGFDPNVDALMEKAIEVLRSKGAEIVDPVELPTWQDYDGATLEVLLYELKAGMAEYLADVGGENPPRTLADLIAFNEERAGEQMPFFGQELFEQAEAKGGLDDEKYRQALARARRVSREEGIDAAMDAENLDAIIAPTGGPAWPTDPVSGDRFGGGSSTPAAVAGYPNITVPMGYVFGLPVGISFFGRAWSEPTLLRLAYAFEQATQVRQPPRYLPTVDATAPPHSGL